MNLPDGVTHEMWEELCVRMGWWKPGQRDITNHREHNPWGNSSGAWGCPICPTISCPPVTDERLMQVLRAGLERNASFLKEVHIQIYQQYLPADPTAAIICAYLALPKE